MQNMHHPTADGVVIPVPDSKVADWVAQGWRPAARPPAAPQPKTKPEGA